MQIKRKIIKIDEEKCNGCGLCVPSCAEGAIQVVDGKARLVSEKFCDGLGVCLGECPNGALSIIEFEAEAFEKETAEKHLKPRTLPCGCPPSLIHTFSSITPCEAADKPVSQINAASALSHWPIQIRLVPPDAPFLKGADLLVVADCTPVAYPRFHEEFLRGKIVLMGCPKFDDMQSYVMKFADIFEKSGIQTITVLVMEVPCCQGLPVIIQKAMELAGKKIPIQKVIINTRGGIVK
jgi:Pyruvate/2-oxoacid:ferredoxin oxidoreductase delta subunit